jgi:uncharacterized protein
MVIIGFGRPLIVPILEGGLIFHRDSKPLDRSPRTKEHERLKIAVVASPDNIPEAKETIGQLKAMGHDTVGLKFNDSWIDVPRPRLDQMLTGVSHILCMADRHNCAHAWFALIVGLARGKSIPLAMRRTDPSWKPAPWLAEIQLFDDETMLLEFYKAEAADWTVKDTMRTAKSTLLELGISWHAESLSLCVKEGDTKAVDLFLRSGFPPDVRDKFGVPIICLAARSKHRSIVELLLDRGAHVDSLSDDRGYSALLDAAQQGDQGILELLLNRGANPNTQSKDGQTALILAVGRNDVRMVSALLEGGADPGIVDKLGLSAKKYAKLFNHPAVLALFGSIA